MEDSSPVEVDSENLNMKVFDNPNPAVEVVQLTAAASGFMAAGNEETTLDIANPVVEYLLKKAAIPLLNRFMKLGIDGTGVVSYLNPGEFRCRENSCF